MPRKSPWTIEELMDRTIPDGSCRIWFGPQLKGQPIVRINGLRTPVKRAIFTLQGGREPIPTKTGQIVRYTARCGHALCVAPEHIEPVLTNEKAPLPKAADENTSWRSPEQLANLAQGTVAKAMRNRHPLDLHWSVA